MKKLSTIILLLVILGGCAPLAPSNVILTNPQTGAKVWLRQPYYYGIGLAVSAANVGANREQAEAIRAYQMMGYTEMEVVR